MSPRSTKLAARLWWILLPYAGETGYQDDHVRHVVDRHPLPAKDGRERLRHADPRTTRKVYIHLKAIDQRRRMDELAVTGVV